jgi:heterodisulfide reductase subunit C
MKALAHWIEEEGYGSKSNSTIFDEEFTRQCIERGRIEDSEVMSNFYKNTKQDIVQMALHGWLGIFVARMNKWTELRQGNVIKFLARTPIMHSLHMGLAMVFKPKTKSWGRTGEVLQQYVKEQKELAHG